MKGLPIIVDGLGDRLFKSCFLLVSFFFFLRTKPFPDALHWVPFIDVIVSFYREKLIAVVGEQKAEPVNKDEKSLS